MRISSSTFKNKLWVLGFFLFLCVSFLVPLSRVHGARPTPAEAKACILAKIGAQRLKEIEDNTPPPPTPAEEAIVADCDNGTPTTPPTPPTIPPTQTPPPEHGYVCKDDHKEFQTLEACKASCATPASCGIEVPVEKDSPRAPVTFVPLTNLPGLSDDVGNRTLSDYINVLYRIAIGLGALFAVIKITYAGIKYMGTDSFSSKEEAKKDITGALFGLLIMLSTVVVLTLIYPDILRINVLTALPELKATPQSTAPGAGTVPEGGVCDNVTKQCAAGVCVTNERTCAPPGNVPNGVCKASCTPVSEGKHPGDSCIEISDCQDMEPRGTYSCRYKTFNTATPPALTGCPPVTGAHPDGGQCLATNCKP